MRITGGDAKGRVLKFPSGSSQRPTSDFLRQALFNLLVSPSDQSFLDLFAGSGSVGLEAASRQATSVVMVEKNKSLADVIRENVAMCGYPDVCSVIQADVVLTLRDLFKKNIRFDVIFADPPYNKGFVGEILGILKDCPLLCEGGILVFQHSVREPNPQLADGWFVSDQRKYGDNLLTFIRMGE